MTNTGDIESNVIHIQAIHLRGIKKGTRIIRSKLRKKLAGEGLQKILYECKGQEVWIELDEKNVITKCISGAGFVSTHECTVVRIFGGNPDIVSLVPVGNAEEAAEDDSSDVSDVSLSTTAPYYIFHDH
jgi:hypothetical protein